MTIGLADPSSTREVTPRITPWLYAALRTGAISMLLYAVVILAPLLLSYRGIVRETAAWRFLLLAALFYFTGHLLRVVRLALLIGNARISIRRLGTLHLFTSGVAMVAPWKLGDVYRAMELAAVLGRIATGLTCVWIERIFDAAVLAPIATVLIAFLYLSGGQTGVFLAYGGLIVLMAFFVLASVALVALVPDNLRRIGTYLIRRHPAAWTISVLRFIDDARAAARQIPDRLRGRVASILALSTLIWLFEILAFAMAAASFHDESSVQPGLLAFLSAAASGSILSDVSAGEHREWIPYLMAAQLPLALSAAAAGLYYLAAVRRAQDR